LAVVEGQSGVTFEADGFKRSSCFFSRFVIPAEVGIDILSIRFRLSQPFKIDRQMMDSRLRGNDEALSINDLVRIATVPSRAVAVDGHAVLYAQFWVPHGLR
jgi:hypothetical protein